MSTQLPPVIAIRAITAESLPDTELAVVDCTEQLKGADHPAFAVMAFVKDAPGSEKGSFVPLLLDSLPQVYDTPEMASERVRYFKGARKHGAMLTLAGLRTLIDKMVRDGVPSSAAVCMPLLGGGDSMAVVRCGGAHVLRMQAQHERNGAVIEPNSVKHMIVLDCGVLPPQS